MPLPSPQPCHLGHTTTSQMVAWKAPSDVHRAKPTHCPTKTPEDLFFCSPPRPTRCRASARARASAGPRPGAGTPRRRTASSARPGRCPRGGPSGTSRRASRGNSYRRWTVSGEGGVAARAPRPRRRKRHPRRPSTCPRSAPPRRARGRRGRSPRARPRARGGREALRRPSPNAREASSFRPSRDILKMTEGRRARVPPGSRDHPAASRPDARPHTGAREAIPPAPPRSRACHRA